MLTDMFGSNRELMHIKIVTGGLPLASGSWPLAGLWSFVVGLWVFEDFCFWQLASGLWRVFGFWVLWLF